MIHATFYDGEKGSCVGCTVSGHAGHAAYGEDIVCAYVSGAVQLAANLCTDSFQLPVVAREEEHDARVVIELTGTDITGDVDRILRGLEAQLKLLEEAYPRSIQVKHKEV